MVQMYPSYSEKEECKERRSAQLAVTHTPHKQTKKHTMIRQSQESATSKTHSQKSKQIAA
jgi:hypothetical protein